VDIPLTIRDLEPADLADLDWSGGSEHLRTVAVQLTAAYAGDAALLVGALPNRRLVALGAADFRRVPGTAVLWLLAVHETLQSLGISTRLIRALEQRAVDQGCRRARLLAEQDNPRAAALYRRLGYRERGSVVERLPNSGGQTYVTVSWVLERALP